MVVSRRETSSGRRKAVGALLLAMSAGIIARLRMTKSFLNPKALIQNEYLPTPERSPWAIIWNFGDDLAFQAATTLTRASFNHVLGQFSKYYIHRCHTPLGGRPPRLVEKSAVLGMLLRSYCDPCDLKVSYY